MHLMHLPILYPGLMCVAVLGSLAGCTTQELRLPFIGNDQNTATQQNTQNESLNKLVSILNYEQFIHGLQAEDLELERDLLETSLDTATDAALVKLALLYAHNEAPFYDAVHALSILQACTENNAEISVEVRSLSILIAELLVQTIDQRKALKATRNKLKKERSQTKILEEQLDALKAIEESINDRSNRLSEIIRQ
jgi:hypothetical protein